MCDSPLSCIYGRQESWVFCMSKYETQIREALCITRLSCAQIPFVIGMLWYQSQSIDDLQRHASLLSVRAMTQVTPIVVLV